MFGWVLAFLRGILRFMPISYAMLVLKLMVAFTAIHKSVYKVDSEEFDKWMQLSVRTI